MNIAFDALAILGALSKNRGIGNYALSQFRTMIQADKKNHYFFFNCIEPFHLFEETEKQDNLDEDYFYLGKDFVLANNPAFSELYGELIKSYIKKNKIDIFYITSPFEGHIISYRKEWFKEVKTIATVYDIIPFVFKEHYLQDRNSKKWYMDCVEKLRWVDKILVISKSVKDDLVKYLHFRPDNIACIWGAGNNRYRVIDIKDNDKEYFNSKFGVKENFIMCTGGDDERKNIGGLIKAYSRLDKKLIDYHQLVIVCKLSQQAIANYTQLANKLAVGHNVILTNFVSDDELLKLYNMAYLMAFPSKYEGFGLPVVEAFACGTPVLTSNNSSLGEIAGDAAYLVDPFDIDSIKEGLNKALTDDKIEEMIQRGYEQVKKFQWPIVAKETIRYFETLKNISYSKHMTCEKKTLAFFSPLPPIQSGISDYSVDVLNGLSKYFEITVFIDDGYSSDCKLANNIKVYNHHKFIKTDFDYVLYQYGNSIYHNYMTHYIQHNHGILVLHDYNLQGLVSSNCLYSKNADFLQYSQILEEDYPRNVVKEYIDKFKTKGQSSSINNMVVNGFVVNYADKIIVHSDENREKLLKKDIKRTVKTIRHYAKIEDIIPLEVAKEKLGLDKNTKILAAFGHIHETKRIIPILKAVTLLKDKYQDFKIIFCGKLDEGLKDKFQQIVIREGLEKLITVTGYVGLDEFLRYLDATDICLNLRYPYNGETSGSLMRILAKQKCVLVNDIGSFSEMPDNCCIKLPNVADLSEEQEVQNLFDSLDCLFKEPEKIRQYGIAARKYAEKELDLDVICREYYDFIVDKTACSLTEDILKQFKVEEIEIKHYSYEQVRDVAKTLAYLKINR